LFQGEAKTANDQFDYAEQIWSKYFASTKDRMLRFQQFKIFTGLAKSEVDQILQQPSISRSEKEKHLEKAGEYAQMAFLLQRALNGKMESCEAMDYVKKVRTKLINE